MAYCYSTTSFIVNLTKEQSSFAIEVSNWIINEYSEDINEGGVFDYSVDVVEVVKVYMKEVGDYMEQCLGFYIEQTNEGLRISHDDYIVFNSAAVFVQCILKYFELNSTVSFIGCTYLSGKFVEGCTYSITKDNINSVYLTDSRCEEKNH